MANKKGRPKKDVKKTDAGKRICVVLGKDPSEALASLVEATGCSTTVLVERALLAYAEARKGATA